MERTCSGKESDETSIMIKKEMSDVVYGYSSRAFGDMRILENRMKFLKTLGFTKDVILPEQVHGNVVKILTNDAIGRISGADGLVTLKGSAPIGVLGADCTPLVAVDSEVHVIGVAHAGWRGTIANIAGELISAMKKVGASEKNIYVSIGPHIGMCCYSVPEERAMQFLTTFGKDAKMASRIGDEWHLDIGWTSYQQLVAAGVQKEHIDAPVICTSCQSDTYFSYRKSGKKHYGEQMGVIGFV